MKIKEYPEYIFWSYDKNSDLPEETVISNVCLYGDVSDILKVYSETSRLSFEKAVKQIELSNRFKKRVNFIKKVIMN